MSKVFWSLFLVVGLISIASNSHAAVEYVKVCSLYGADFYYIPGTDACLNTTTGEIRQATAVGTWYALSPNNSGLWVANLKDGCQGGRLLKVGTFTSSDFTANSHNKYETPLFPLNLKPGEFISNVILSGGFDVTSRSTFCLSFYDASTGLYSPIGCQNTAQLMNQPAAFSFVPSRSVPPAGFTSPFKLVGSNADENWGFPDPLTFNGVLSCWVCLQHVAPTPPGPK
ncbi:MAG: porin [Thermoanaerobaculales bacterium]